MTNPYVSRGPVRTPEMFFGRTHALQEIAAFLRGNQSVSIIGPRKMGKTSLLFHLQRAEAWPALGLEDKNLFVYLDCEVLGEGRHEEIFGQFAGEMAAALETRGLPVEPALEAAVNKPTRLSFEAAVRKLNQRGLRVVLILDEFERLSTNPHLDVNFFNALRSAAGRYQLVFLTASARPLIELTYSGKSQEILSSPFFNIFAPLFLGPLAEAEARQLIAAPSQQAGVTFGPAVQDFIYTLVGGHPLALQVACFHAFDLPTDTAEIERRTMQELNAHFQYYWRNLTSSEQDTLRQLSSAALRETSDTTIRGLLRDLIQKGLLVLEGGAYRYPSRAWTEFLAAQVPARSAQTATGSLTGTHLGPYEVLEPLGRGGMAEVYKGYHPRLDRTVAIKILPARLAADDDFRQRFEREARAIAALKHPNVVQVFDFGDSAQVYYMVMEFIAGRDLAHLMRERGPLPLTEALPLIQDVAGALDYAHAQGLVHRDVKPSNVMLEIQKAESGGQKAEPADRLLPTAYRAVLTDFGIAKMLTGNTGATKTAMLGTLDYMAPEQIRAASEVDGRADQYALGVLAYQLLTGQLPFSGDHPGAVLMAHLQQPPPDPRRHAPALPDAAAQALLRAMAKDPDERFRRVAEFGEALRAGLG
jgi:tRNA A-37 threonylcarbamoyl transferase component Bud32